MNSLYEVTFSVGNSSDTRYLTTQVSAFTPQQAESMIRAQYGSECEVHSCYLKS
jgi:hypothetical protein